MAEEPKKREGVGEVEIETPEKEDEITVLRNEDVVLFGEDASAKIETAAAGIASDAERAADQAVESTGAGPEVVAQAKTESNFEPRVSQAQDSAEKAAKEASAGIESIIVRGRGARGAISFVENKPYKVTEKKPVVARGRMAGNTTQGKIDKSMERVAGRPTKEMDNNQYVASLDAQRLETLPHKRDENARAVQKDAEIRAGAAKIFEGIAADERAKAAANRDLSNADIGVGKAPSEAGVNLETKNAKKQAWEMTEQDIMERNASTREQRATDAAVNDPRNYEGLARELAGTQTETAKPIVGGEKKADDVADAYGAKEVYPQVLAPKALSEMRRRMDADDGIVPEVADTAPRETYPEMSAKNALDRVIGEMDADVGIMPKAAAGDAAITKTESNIMPGPGSQTPEMQARRREIANKSFNEPNPALDSVGSMVAAAAAAEQKRKADVEVVRSLAKDSGDVAETRMVTPKDLKLIETKRAEEAAIKEMDETLAADAANNAEKERIGRQASIAKKAEREDAQAERMSGILAEDEAHNANKEYAGRLDYSLRGVEQEKARKDSPDAYKKIASIVEAQRQAKPMKVEARQIEKSSSQPEVAQGKSFGQRAAEFFSPIRNFFSRKPKAEAAPVIEKPTPMAKEKAPNPPGVDEFLEGLRTSGASTESNVEELLNRITPEVKAPGVAPVAEAPVAETIQPAAAEKAAVPVPTRAEKNEVTNAVEAKELSNEERFAELMDLKNDWNEIIRITKEIKKLDRVVRGSPYTAEEKAMDPDAAAEEMKKLMAERDKLSSKVVDAAEALSNKKLRSKAAEMTDFERGGTNKSLENMNNYRLYNIELAKMIQEVYKEQVNGLPPELFKAERVRKQSKLSSAASVSEEGDTYDLQENNTSKPEKKENDIYGFKEENVEQPAEAEEPESKVEIAPKAGEVMSPELVKQVKDRIKILNSEIRKNEKLKKLRDQVEEIANKRKRKEPLTKKDINALDRLAEMESEKGAA